MVDSRDPRQSQARQDPDIVDLETHPDAHVTVNQLARYLRVERKIIVKWIDAGVLPAYRYGGVLRVKTADAQTFARQQLRRRERMTPEQQEAAKGLYGAYLEALSTLEGIGQAFVRVVDQIERGAPADQILSSEQRPNVTHELRRLRMLRDVATRRARALGVTIPEKGGA